MTLSPRINGALMPALTIVIAKARDEQLRDTLDSSLQGTQQSDARR